MTRRRCASWRAAHFAPWLVALFFTTLLARIVRADMRKRIRELFGRSYV